MNINVDVAYNGQQAIDLAKVNPNYELILMDINMPVVDGISAVQRLKEENIPIPVIALTATDIRSENQHYLNYGFAECISKPIDRNQFVKVISRFLDHSIDDAMPLLDDATMENLRANYIASLKQDLDKLRVAQAIGDYTTIKGIAHRIKGSASCFGFPDMSQQFSIIETQYSEYQDDHKVLEEGMRLIERLWLPPTVLS